MIKSILIHSCCAHCTAYTVKHWQQQGYVVRCLWYNPNIHPYTEHQYRLKAMQSLARTLRLHLILNQDYDAINYFRMVVGDEGQRCRHCFQLRLAKTAEIASRSGFTMFTSTLLVSPHQQHDLLREIGGCVAQDAGIEFGYVDLRKYYSDSRRLTKGLNLYRQQYCGCFYSEWERYAGIRIE